jgi:hypothetical protein
MGRFCHTRRAIVHGMETFLKLGIFISPIAFLVGSFAIARKWRIGWNASLCAHGGQTKQTAIIFGAITITSAVWYYAAWLLFLYPRLVIPYFYEIFVLATAGIIVISLVPTSSLHPKASLVHRIAGVVQGTILVTLALLIATNNKLSGWGHWGLWSFVILTVLFMIAYVYIPHVRKQVFVIEATCIALFSLSISAIALSL